MEYQSSMTGELESPGGFTFGIQGWTWGEQRPVSITFFLDGSAMVCDQYGRSIRGTVNDGKEVWFALTPPEGMMVTEGQAPPYKVRHREVFEGGKLVKKQPLATHMQVIEALAAERIDWTRLTWAGPPQLSYEQLKKIPNLPTISISELRRIPDEALRKDALRVRREVESSQQKEMEALLKGGPILLQWSAIHGLDDMYAIPKTVSWNYKRGPRLPERLWTVSFQPISQPPGEGAPLLIPGKSYDALQTAFRCTIASLSANPSSTRSAGVPLCAVGPTP